MPDAIMMAHDAIRQLVLLALPPGTPTPGTPAFKEFWNGPNGKLYRDLATTALAPIARKYPSIPELHELI